VSRLPFAFFICLLGLAATWTAPLHGQPKLKVKGALVDEEIVARGRLVAAGKLVDLYQHEIEVEPAFLKLAETAYQRLEEITGRKFDIALLGKVRIYVSSAVGPAHVWKGYSHRDDPKGIVFLNRKVYQEAMAGKDSTYAHELAHLLTWRYQSHSLREGLATHLAQELLPGTGSGLSPEGTDWTAAIPPELVDLLGTTKSPVGWTNTDTDRRRLYYQASHRFVAYLMSKGTFDQFMTVYESEQPAATVEKVYGSTRAELARQAMELRQPPTVNRKTP
jgi:hypothetical protein